MEDWMDTLTGMAARQGFIVTKHDGLWVFEKWSGRVVFATPRDPAEFDLQVAALERIGLYVPRL